MTTQRDKGRGKPRQRTRKTDQKVQRGEKRASTQRDRADRDSMVEIAAPVEGTPIEQAMIEQAPMEPELIEEKAENDATEATLVGEVLPPEIRSHVTPQPLQGIGLPAIAAAYVDYARKSWAAGRMLVERFMTARSLEEAIEVQGDFARQSFTNFLIHSQQVGGHYAGFTRQFFRPLESLTTDWTRVGR